MTNYEEFQKILATLKKQVEPPEYKDDEVERLKKIFNIN